ncbi:M23 family metallopeptidase [Devosia sp. PTR5]|uniref:M23 family metallopeptidase n=2 Tax=Devosia oryzisoli TaxID=2774138 RepID=A0A927IS93_9HYPH|nr:M23 family metallopeptidase [Devosia oryzisoli]
MFALLLGANALTATGMLMAPDIARLVNGQNERVIEAYEGRLTQMRLEIDRLQSRNYAQTGDMNLQLQELSQQQEMLVEQHQLVKALVDKAGQLGITPVASLGTPALRTVSTPSGNPDLAATAAQIGQMISDTQVAMSGIADAATARTDGIVSEMARLGIKVDLPEGDLEGIGGPLLDAVDGVDASPMVEDANAVMETLIRYKAAREVMEDAPVHMPIAGTYRQSSIFGNRRDPFTGRRAFHAGLDFAASTGTTVSSAGDGVVSYVGTRSGYGKVVEVRHANGLMTRYGHLSAQLAHVGQVVQTGTPIARVGSTGRSTGPHLHFEIRRSDSAIDPKPFLEAGKRLVALLQ